MKIFFLTLFWIIVSYLFGSIPWGLVIGKVFYQKDIRQYGSGNLGGTNAGRVLGKPAGVAVILLDAFKAAIVMTLCHKFFPEGVVISGLFVAVGHCFPIFAQFRGGKAVACAVGYLFALGILGYADFIFLFICPVLFFFLTLALTRYVSLSSIICLLSAFAIANIVATSTIRNCLFFLACLVIYRHIPNLLRILQGKESKVTWIR